ncbi:hypothetical protein PsYK624_079530 [Phanerochaete sordida]|uniref:Uncharacterized protein n=1 Tax=Phanerochaete sordida TaxID=48140 RepID=A0A9P3GBX4_9APHY|nr:hypothetical protein PsYK624_079530 [Phanerochaete sordida]
MNDSFSVDGVDDGQRDHALAAALSLASAAATLPLRVATFTPSLGVRSDSAVAVVDDPRAVERPAEIEQRLEFNLPT